MRHGGFGYSLFFRIRWYNYVSLFLVIQRGDWILASVKSVAAVFTAFNGT